MRNERCEPYSQATSDQARIEQGKSFDSAKTAHTVYIRVGRKKQYSATYATIRAPPPALSRRTKSGDVKKPCLHCVHWKLSPGVHASFLTLHHRYAHSYYSLSGSYLKHDLAWAKSRAECEEECLRFVYTRGGFVYAPFTSHRLYFHQTLGARFTHPETAIRL